MASVAAGPAFVPPFSIAARGAGRAGGVFGLPFDALFFEEHGLAAGADTIRSEERRVGKECAA